MLLGIQTGANCGDSPEAGRWHAAPPAPASRSLHHWLSWLAVLTPRRPGRRRRRPPQAWPSRNMARAIPPSGVADLRVVGEVAGEADGCLGHGASLLMPGRAVCPALGPRGTVDTVACHQSTRGKRWSQRRRPYWNGSPAMGGSGAELVGGVLAAGGWACQELSGQIPPPWVWWENEAPATRTARRPRPRPGPVSLASLYRRASFSNVSPSASTTTPKPTTASTTKVRPTIVPPPSAPLWALRSLFCGTNHYTGLSVS
jgi:hypothetical protein